jgi:uncharacterized membrane protein
MDKENYFDKKGIINGNKVGSQQKLKKPPTAAAVAVQKNIDTILKLEKAAVQSRSIAEHIADKVTKFAGSAPFIIIHFIWFTVWILVNCRVIPRITPFDPFPFSFLTLVVSLEAIFLTLLVLMSQNRMTKEADNRAHLDLQINMLGEQETTITLRMVQKIAKHLGLNEEKEETLKELCEETDINHVAQRLAEESTE